MTVESVIYVSTARGAALSNISRTTAVWEAGMFSDDNIKAERIITAACSVRKYHPEK